MQILKHLKKIFNPEPKEQVLGYSRKELKELFSNATPEVDNNFLKTYPLKISLQAAEISAFYVSQLIDKHDTPTYLEKINSHFEIVVKKPFNTFEVNQLKGKKRDEVLCYFLKEEFGGDVISFVTDSVDFLKEITYSSFFVPPPWIAFDNYPVEWWGAAMQGDAEYYDSNFFYPFFIQLDEDKKNKYYQKI